MNTKRKEANKKKHCMKILTSEKEDKENITN